MRPYRGKRIDNGEWVYGWYVEISGRYLIVTNKATLVVGNNYWFSLKGFTEVDPATVGQQIGKQDKNGKEIYEGDIVKMLKKGDFLKGELCKVGYSDTWGQYWLTAKKGNTNHWMGSWVETIGTIHDKEKEEDNEPTN